MNIIKKVKRVYGDFILDFQAEEESPQARPDIKHLLRFLERTKIIQKNERIAFEQHPKPLSHNLSVLHNFLAQTTCRGCKKRFTEKDRGKISCFKSYWANYFPICESCVECDMINRDHYELQAYDRDCNLH